MTRRQQVKAAAGWLADLRTVAGALAGIAVSISAAVGWVNARVEVIAKAAAQETVKPVAEDYREHKVEAAALRPVMLGWKEDATTEMRAQSARLGQLERNTAAICAATHARCP
jgi:hypothetical protein